MILEITGLTNELEIKHLTDIFGLNDNYKLKLSLNNNIVKLMLFYNDIKVLENQTSINEFIDLKQFIYKNLENYTKNSPKWGILTGIRPSKISTKMLLNQIPENDILQQLEDKYLISKDRAKLLLNISKISTNIIEKYNLNTGFSVYIGIPFCKTICSYCSFTVTPLKHYKDFITPYVDALINEISILKNKNPKTIYVGGGTPTALDDYNLERLLFSISNFIDLSKVLEFTVEAGRPDTITENKLKILKKYGVQRISINPQTSNDNTLKKIGRSHMFSDIIKCIYDARNIGFNNINMDLILGLNNEDINIIKKSLNDVLNLTPENITIHTLAIKRASSLTKNKNMYNGNISTMVDYSIKTLLNNSYNPYYLYRQKNIYDNLENIGYAKKDLECLYNIIMIEELHSVLAFGSPASSKIINNKIIRIENPKDIKTYIEKIEELKNRKEIYVN